MDIPEEKLLWMYRTMVTTRKLYETMYEMYRHGSSLGNFVAGEGEEAIPAAICANLRREDSYKPNFRQTSCLFAKEGYELADIFSGNLFDAERGYLGFSLALGEDVGVYTGFALAAQMRGTEQVCVCTFGDGTASKGSIHEAMVTAAAWKLPIVFVLQNKPVLRRNALLEGLPLRRPRRPCARIRHPRAQRGRQRRDGDLRGRPGVRRAGPNGRRPGPDRGGDLSPEPVFRAGSRRDRHRRGTGPKANSRRRAGTIPSPGSARRYPSWACSLTRTSSGSTGTWRDEIARAMSDGRQRPRVDYDEYIRYAVAEL